MSSQKDAPDTPDADSLFMTDELQDRVQTQDFLGVLDGPQVLQPVQMTCMLETKEASISGTVVSLLIGDKKLSVALRLPKAVVQDALQCTRFSAIGISMDGASLYSRVIPDTWEQSKEVIPDLGEVMFVLTAARKPSGAE